MIPPEVSCAPVSREPARLHGEAGSGLSADITDGNIFLFKYYLIDLAFVASVRAAAQSVLISLKSSPSASARYIGIVGAAVAQESRRRARPE